MAQNLSQIMWGEGVAFLDGYELFEIQELIINFGLNTLEAVKGDGGGNIVIPTNQPITGRAGFLGLNAATFSKLTGGSSATGTKKRIREEELTVSTNTVTTSQTPIANTMRVIEQGANKQPLKQVSGTPAEDDEYQISGTTITFKTGTFSDGTIMVVSYIYADAANGETVQIGTTDLPSSFELYGSLRTKEKFSNVKSDIIIYAAKCERTGEFGMGSAVGSVSTPGFDFNVEVDNPGDLEIYFP